MDFLLGATDMPHSSPDPWLAALALLLAWIAREVIPALFKLRAESLAGHVALVTELRDRIENCERQLSESQEQHRHCLEVQSDLRAQVAALTERVANLSKGLAA